MVCVQDFRDLCLRLYPRGSFGESQRNGIWVLADAARRSEVGSLKSHARSTLSANLSSTAVRSTACHFRAKLCNASVRRSPRGIRRGCFIVAQRLMCRKQDFWRICRRRLFYRSIAVKP